MTTEVNVYTDAFPYPDNPAMRAAFRFPVLLYRMGFFNLIEKKIMLLSTYGRRSGKPRPIAIEYNKLDGRKFVIAAYGEKADWVQNMLADPHITLQSMDGIESVIGRRVVSDDELSQAYQVFEQNPFFQGYNRSLGFEQMDLQVWLDNRDLYYVVTFDLTEEPTPPPLEKDLTWLLPALGVTFALGWVFGRFSSCCKR